MPANRSTKTSSPPPISPSTWSPLRYPVYRALWSAQLASNVGTWMQLVGAQWLMGTLGGSVAEVAFVQTAVTLPMVFLALPGGAIGDVLDRRRLLLIAQSFMLVCAAGLAALTFTGTVTPALLLGLMFALGIGTALTLPSWQAVQPELVSREEIPGASALAGISMNIARAVGPAGGGAIVALSGPGAVFLLNAFSFAAVVAALGRWKREPTQRRLAAEHLAGAIRTGARYVRSSPRLRAVLIRGSLFMLLASAVWALLPIVARDRLELGAGGYGALLGLVGVGAVLGGLSLGRVRARFSTNVIVTSCSLGYAITTVAVALADQAWVVGAAMLAGGLCWIGVLASLNATAQMVLPSWVRARGMAIYLTVFFAGQAGGGLVWGLVAQARGTDFALLLVAAGLAFGTVLGTRFPLASTQGLDMSAAAELPTLEHDLDRGAEHGPVLVTVEYRVPLENHEQFRDVLAKRGRARRRSGASGWGLYQDGHDPNRFVETFAVATWQEFLRQRGERLTVLDVALRDEALALVEEGSTPRVEHLLSAYDR